MLLDGEVKRQVHTKIKFVKYFKVCQEAELVGRVENFCGSFDLEKAPLWRTELFSADIKRHLLVFNIHHIIFDGISENILLQELTALYSGRELPPVKHQIL